MSRCSNRSTAEDIYYDKVGASLILSLELHPFVVNLTY